MNKKNILIIILTLLASISLSAQSNEELDRFFAQDKADLMTSAWLVYLAAGALPADAMPKDAMEPLLSSSLGKRYAGKTGGDPIRYGEFA